MKTMMRIMKRPEEMTLRSIGRESWRLMRRSMKVTTNSDIYPHELYITLSLYLKGTFDK